MSKEQICEINDHIKDGIEHWARFCLQAEADQWAVLLNYDKHDVMNVCLLFQHVCSNIGIKAGHIDEKKAVEFGNRLHDLILDMTGVDTHKVYHHDEK